MSNNKKKAAAIAAVKIVVDTNQNNAIYPTVQPTEPAAWTQLGKQMTTANRNMVQLKPGRNK